MVGGLSNRLLIMGSMHVKLSHVLRSANAMADVLAKQGIARLSSFLAYHL